MNILLLKFHFRHTICDITDGVSKMKLQKQNIHNEIYAEVEKISYKLLQLI